MSKNIFHLKIDDSYLDIEESRNPLNQHRVICSTIRNNTTQLWYLDEGTLKHYQTNGYLTKKYHGWIPSRSNIILQREHDYDIENDEPFQWTYTNGSLTIQQNDCQYQLCKDLNQNIILQKEGNTISNKWELILRPINTC
tara:strand:- start:2206 stop:2625 length:420 start_codon:yes stop_codon:yes gene_type:complete